MRRPTRSSFHRPAIQTLERLHSELSGQIAENKDEAQRLARQMLQVETVIKLLDPTFNLRRVAEKRRKPNPWFKPGTVYRRAVDVLRTATEPLTAREIAERVLEAAKITNPDKAALDDLIGTVLASLRNHQGKGVEQANEGGPARWRLSAPKFPSADST
jgi:hypothetical protein